MRASILKELPKEIPVGRANNLIGKKFGRLTVLYRCNPPDHVKKRDQTYWVCKCECGNYIQVRTGALVTNGVQSCGCLHSEVARQIMNEVVNKAEPWNKQDLIGQRFGKLVAIENYSRNGKSFWKCKCDCGGSRDVETYNLVHQKVFDCGCGNCSTGEYQILKFLQKNNVQYKKEYTFPDLIDKQNLRFDFAIFNKEQLSCLIEFQGIQHYQKNNYWFTPILQKHDIMKKEYCKKHNLKLIEIMYTDNIEEKLQFLLK